MAAERQEKLYCCYLDFYNAFGSPDHEALWEWLRKLNIPDIDLLQALYKEAYYEADLPYGRSAPIFLKRGLKQGDRLPPLLFGLIFNALLLALKATGIGHRTITGLRTSARGFADDLALVTSSAGGMSRLLQVVADFCEWSGMRIKLEKSVITAYDYKARQELATDEILYKGEPLAHLAADDSFPYLGVRASLVARRKRGVRAPGLESETEHIFSATRELVGVARGHKYLLGQMVPAMHMVAASRFRYSAPLVPWTDAELNRLYRVWLQVHRAAWRLTPGFPSGQLTLPSERGGCPLEHPIVSMIQALSKHIEQLVALPDDLRQDTIARYKRLCTNCGCHTQRELAVYLAAERSPRRCPIARLLRACGQLGLDIRLPDCLSLGRMEGETSWSALLAHLRRRTAAPGIDSRTQSDMECVTAAWTTIQRRFRRRGIREPRQLVLDPRADRAVWLLPNLARAPGWMESLRRVLSVADPATLFPRANRGEGVPDTPAHQALMHEVLTALSRPVADVPRLFEDDRWERVRYTAPLFVWKRLLEAHGLVISFDKPEIGHRRTAPILDLMALGHCPGIPAACLRSLCLGLAPHLCTVRDDAVAPDGGPLTWKPAHLTRERVDFFFNDETAGSETFGPYTASTKDGLTRVTQYDQHITTLTQGRWGLLRGAYEAENVCAALHAWVAQIDREEASHGVASSQFWYQLRTVLEADCIVGCNPLVAPSSFPVALRCWGTLEGWGHSDPHPSRILYCLLTQSREEQRILCRPLRADDVWWALTRESVLDSEVKDILSQLSSIVMVFKRGTRAAAAKGSWRRATLRTVQIKEKWTLWASYGAAQSTQLRAALKRRLDSIRLTKDGVVPLDLTCPAAREAALGPAAAAYRKEGIVVATDGSLKEDGAMGAAFVSLGERLPARSAAILGPPSSVRPELAGIAMACEDCPREVDLTVLTDSVSCMRLLMSLQRTDFPLSLYRHPVRQLLMYVARLINERAAANAVTRFWKVKSHRAEPLNEAADALADAAVELDPSRPLDLDPEAVHFIYKETLVEWDSKLRDHLIQVAASRGMSRIGAPTRRRDGTVTPAQMALSTAWMLRPEQGRSTLGGVLRSMKTSPRKRRIFQALAGTFPCQAVLFKWRIATSPLCTLCGKANESLAHIQCVCPVLREARIRAHHNLAAMLFTRLGQEPCGWSIHQEVTVDCLRGIDTPLDCRDAWQRACDALTDMELVGPDEDAVIDTGLGRKRPDAFAFNWRCKTVLILEFTRAYDARPDWHTETDRYKTDRYAPLRDKLRSCLAHTGSGRWSVDIVPLTLGVRGSFDEGRWALNLAKFGLSQGHTASLMTDLVTLCLSELNELLAARTVALNNCYPHSN